MGSFSFAKRIAGYNWPLYATAFVAILIGLVVALFPGTPLFLRCLATLGIVGAVWFSVASFMAFNLMFDRSGLLSGHWLLTELSPPPARWIQINAGLEETSIPLQNVFPESTGREFDIFDPTAMTEPAITRARQLRAGGASITTKSNALAVEDGQADLVLVMLAAHELRDRAAREQFFRELARVVSPTGKVLVVEHLRNLAAALAFGPGMFHFYLHHEWIQLGTLAGLQVERERHITPFVRVFVFSKRTL